MSFNDRFTCSIMVKGITKFRERVPCSEQHSTTVHLAMSEFEATGECSAVQETGMSDSIRMSIQNCTRPGNLHQERSEINPQGCVWQFLAHHVGISCSVGSVPPHGFTGWCCWNLSDSPGHAWFGVQGGYVLCASLSACSRHQEWRNDSPCKPKQKIAKARVLRTSPSWARCSMPFSRYLFVCQCCFVLRTITITGFSPQTSM